MSKTEEKEKSYVIKVPVFTSELISRGMDIFGGVKYSDMNIHVRSKVAKYLKTNAKVSRIRKNKVQKKEIDSIECIDCIIGDRPSILLKITAYNTNLLDGYVETDKKIKLGQDDKIGSVNNFVLLVPNILGVDVNNYKHQWIILVYEDPNKDNQEIISTVKLVVNKIINISTTNIKLPEVLEELKRIKNIPELALNYTAISYNENEVGAKYRSYLIGSKFSKQEQNKFENMPFEITEELINDSSYENSYQKRVIKIVNGKKEYRITREGMNDAKESLKEVVEEMFNETIGISETELKERMYNTDFIIEKLTPILQNYLT